jgi:hypothetical protein
LFANLQPQANGVGQPGLQVQQQELDITMVNGEDAVTQREEAAAAECHLVGFQCST